MIQFQSNDLDVLIFYGNSFFAISISDVRYLINSRDFYPVCEFINQIHTLNKTISLSHNNVLKPNDNIL